MTNIEKLVQKLSALPKASGNETANALAALETGHKQKVFGIISEALVLFDLAVDEINTCQFRDESRRRKWISSLETARFRLLESLQTSTVTEKVGLSADDIERFEVFADVVSEQLGSDVDTGTFDSSTFVAETAKLIAEVQEWEIPLYTQKALLLQLNAISRTAQESSIASDTAIRMKVKSVVADFAVEFATMDKDFRTRWERILGWASFGMRGGTKLLGYSSDAASIAGLLPKP